MSNATINIYPIGTYVKFINGTEQNSHDEKLPTGMITEINIRQNDALYLIVWWNGNSRCSDWVTDLEFIPVGNNTGKAKIGYCR